MTYDARESSVADGSPFFLYEFNTATTTYRYADSAEDVTWNGETWKAFPIKHSDVKQSGEISKNSVKVTMPLEGELVDLFLGWSPDHTVTFTLRRGHVGETDVLVFWKGRITSHKLKDQTIELSCESIFTSLKRTGVRARFQKNCRHALYGRGCGLNKEDFAVVGNADSVAGLVLNVPEAALENAGWFTGGAISFPDGSFRMITNHTGSSITLSRSSRYLSDNTPTAGEPMAVTMYPGCNRTISACKNKFNNLDNQGGFRWIPSSNPMGGSSIV